MSKLRPSPHALDIKPGASQLGFISRPHTVEKPARPARLIILPMSATCQDAVTSAIAGERQIELVESHGLGSDIINTDRG